MPVPIKARPISKIISAIINATTMNKIIITSQKKIIIQLKNKKLKKI